MTRDEILATPAGPATDALVAEKVMGYDPMTDRYCKGHEAYVRANGRGDFHPSTDINAAWEVLEHMYAAGFCFSLDRCATTDRDCPESRAKFMRDGHHINDHYQADRRDWGAFGTVPLAICRAALLTTLPEEEAQRPVRLKQVPITIAPELMPHGPDWRWWEA